MSRWIIVGVGASADLKPIVLGWHEFGHGHDGVPLLGCDFSHGTNDCYGLVRRYYHFALNLELPDFRRDGQWWKDNVSSLYMQHYAQAGFRDMGTDACMRAGDVLLMKIASAVPNHAAIYIGSDEILHHLWGQLSRRDGLPRYRAHITHILRHRKMLANGDD